MSEFTEWLATLTDDDLIMLDHAVKRAYARKSEEAQAKWDEIKKKREETLAELGIALGLTIVLGGEYAQWYATNTNGGTQYPHQGEYKVVGAEKDGAQTWIYYDGGRMPLEVMLRCKRLNLTYR